MTALRLKQFLDEHQVKYQTITHSRAVSAQEVAALTHISGKELAKTVMVKLDGQLAMAVLPASHRVDISLLRRAAGAQIVEVAEERDFIGLFPDCEPGAMPPFGNLYNLATYASTSLAGDEEIAFKAGSHSEVIRLAYQDFERLANPKVAVLSLKDLHLSP